MSISNQDPIQPADQPAATSAAMMPVEDTIREVISQPEAVKAALWNNREAVEAVAQAIIDRDIQSLHLVGSGDSFHIGHCVKQAFENFANMPLLVDQAYEYAVNGNRAVTAQTASFVVSSSGRISTTRDALTRALNEDSLVIGITDQADEQNPFYSIPSLKLIPGAVKNGWPTQTTTAAIALLLDLASLIGLKNGFISRQKREKLHAQLQLIPEQMTHVIDLSRSRIPAFIDRIDQEKVLTFIGSGPGYGVAMIGTALMAEGPQRFGVGYYVEEFHHSLRVHILEQGSPVILIATQDKAYQRYVETVNILKEKDAFLLTILQESDENLAAVPANTIEIPALPFEMSPLLTLLPLHQLSIALSQSREARGYQRPRAST